MFHENNYNKKLSILYSLNTQRPKHTRSNGVILLKMVIAYICARLLMLFNFNFLRKLNNNL